MAERNSYNYTFSYMRKLWTDELTEYMDYINQETSASDELYVLYQYKASGKMRRRKYYTWIKCSPNTPLPSFYDNRDMFISCAKYYRRFRKRGFVAEVNSNYVFLNFNKLQMPCIPTINYIKELVLERCKNFHPKDGDTSSPTLKRGIPEPKMIYTVDGIMLIWRWEVGGLKKEFYDDDFYGNKFNVDWDDMQKTLCDRFEDLGADKRKSSITATYRIPGSINTSKRFEKQNNLVQVIHQGQVVKSYSEMQYYLRLRQSKKPEETPDISQTSEESDATKQAWASFSKDYPEICNEWEQDILKLHKPSNRLVRVSFMKDGQIFNHWVPTF